jgi:SSS family solute:Na+ symporter
MNISFFMFCLFFLQVICFIVGSRSSKGLKNQEDYFLAGKTIRFFPLMMTFLATQVGGGLVLGAAEEAYRFGWSVIFYPLGASLGLILLACGIGKKMAQFQVSTVAQIFEVVYGSAALKKIASALSILSLFMIFVGQMIASSKFMVSMGVDSKALFLIFWGIVIAYTVLGGLKAVVATDIVQASFFIGIFILCFVTAFFLNGEAFSEPIDSTLQTNTFEFDLSKLWGWLLMPLLFMVIEQDMGQRCFAAGSPRIVTKATFWAGLGTLIICMIPIYFGVLANNLNIVVPKGASVLIAAIEQTTTPTVAALTGCAILAAIISTADSLINASFG